MSSGVIPLQIERRISKIISKTKKWHANRTNSGGAGLGTTGQTATEVVDIHRRLLPGTTLPPGLPRSERQLRSYNTTYPPIPALNGVDLRRAGDVNPLMCYDCWKNPGTYVPGSPLEFLKFTPLAPPLFSLARLRRASEKWFIDKLSARVSSRDYPMSSNLARCRAYSLAMK